MAGLFGDIIDGADVEQALLDHLASWMPTYVAAVVRDKDPEGKTWPNGVEAIRAYRLVHAANENWPGDQLPMLLVYSPGLQDQPVPREGGTVDARFQCTVTAIAEGATEDETKALARVYGTAAKLAVMQHPSLGGFAAGADWLDERNFPVTRGVEAERSLMAVAALFVIEVRDVLNRRGGPLEPLEDPSEAPAEWPTVREGGGAAEVTPETRTP